MHPRTVRYYERQGLLNASRSSGGHRLFDPEELDRLNFIISLREAGWSLEEITALLSIRSRANGDRDACRELNAEISTHIERLQQKIAILSKLQENLQETRRFLTICSECTGDGRPALGCETCDRLPEVQPTGFRLTWIAEGRAGKPTFDDPAIARGALAEPKS